MNRESKIKREGRTIKEYENLIKKFGKPLRTLPLEKIIGFVSDYKVISSIEDKEGIKIFKLKKSKK